MAWDVTTSASSSGQTTHLCMGRQEMRDGMRWGCRSRLIFAGQMLQGEVASGHSSRISHPLKCILGRGEVRVKMCIFESRNSIPQDPPDTHCLAGTIQKKDGRGVTLCCSFFFFGGGVYTFSVLVFFQGSWVIPGRLDAYQSAFASTAWKRHLTCIENKQIENQIGHAISKILKPSRDVT